MTCMEVENKEETVEGAQTPVVAAIPAISAKAAPKPSRASAIQGAQKARTVAGIKIKAVSSKTVFTLLQWISKTSMEI